MPAEPEDKTKARRAAIEANGRVWALLQNRNRSPAETAEMIAAAHASLEHWKAAGGPVEDQRGNWLIARAYVDAGLAEPALVYARQVLRLTEAHRNELTDFDLAFAEEIAARALAAAGDQSAAAEHRAMAQKLGEAIADHGDRQEFFRQMALPPWFGLDG
jgi:hypothetical protein